MVPDKIEPYFVGFIENPVDEPILADFINKKSRAPLQVPFFRELKNLAYLFRHAVL